MNMSEKCKQHVDSCRFCWMCHHICPVGNATGHERSTPRARALGISLVNRNAIDLSEIMDNIYECAGCGACVDVCVTGWDPVMFAKETRLEAALDGKLPEYINTLVDNCLEKGNAYGSTALCDKLTAAIENNMDDIAELFSDSENGIMNKFAAALEGAVGTTGDKGTLINKAGLATGSTAKENQLYDMIKRTNDKITMLKKRYESEENRLWKKYSAMESMLSTLNSQSASISSYFA